MPLPPPTREPLPEEPFRNTLEYRMLKWTWLEKSWRGLTGWIDRARAEVKRLRL
jgi:hypothetical protein